MSMTSKLTKNSSEWRSKNEPKPKKARRSRLKLKVILIVFFDYRDVAHLKSINGFKRSIRNTAWPF